ncbi:MAG: glycosyltransferase family 39 protein [Candidatus Undinarchaeales archaeon]|nr:glycosyltransferase family 39 protein [Candidatus Undinarchaeales archaeon]MDP7493774.1 glycosyltransferase family 39 protein [Candidatus Undinarchaeales archaeon]
MYRDVHPPFYLVLVHYVVLDVGDTEWHLRMPSAVAGVLTVLVVYAIGSRTYGRRSGLLAAGLTAVCWCPVYFSQEARGNALMLLFVSMAHWFWFELMTTRDMDRHIHNAYIVGYSGYALLAAYTHYFGLLMVGLQAAGAFLKSIGDRRVLHRSMTMYLIVFLGFAPWIPTMLAQFGARTNISWIERPGEPVFAFAAFLYFLFNRSRYLLVLVGILYASLAAVIFRENDGPIDLRTVKLFAWSPDGIVLAWLVLPFLVTYTVSVVSNPVLVHRNLIISLPAAYLLLARAVDRLVPDPRRFALVATVLCAFFLGDLVLRMDFYGTPYKEQVREAIGHIVTNDRRYPDALIIGHTWSATSFDYYFRQHGSSRRVELMGGTREDVERISTALDERSPRYVWFVRSHREPETDFMTLLHERFDEVEHHSFIRADVWLFKVKGG